MLRGQRNQRSTDKHNRVKRVRRDSPFDEDDQEDDEYVDDEINDADEEQEERYSLS